MGSISHDREIMRKKKLRAGSLPELIIDCLASGYSNVLAGFINPRLARTRGNQYVLNKYFSATNKKGVKIALQRLERRGSLKKRKDGYELTAQGWNDQLVAKVRQADSLSDDRTLMILFDIPESRRTDRDRLRRLLLSAGCIALQRSVYVTPYDIASDLADILRGIGLRDCIRFYYTEYIDV